MQPLRCANLDIVGRYFSNLIRKTIRQRFECAVEVFLVDEHVDVAARAHPRLGIIAAEHRALERQEWDLHGFQRLADPRQLVV